MIAPTLVMVWVALWLFYFFYIREEIRRGKVKRAQADFRAAKAARKKVRDEITRQKALGLHDGTLVAPPVPKLVKPGPDWFDRQSKRLGLDGWSSGTAGKIQGMPTFDASEGGGGGKVRGMPIIRKK